MLLGVIPMFCFEFLRIFGEKLQKLKGGKSGQTQAPMPQRREPTPRRSPTPQHERPSSWRGRGAKIAALGYATA